jgi:hypothetical protein
MPARVGRERWRKPEPLTFRAFSERFMDDYLPGRNLKAISVVTRLAVRLVTARQGLCAAVPAPYVRAAGTSPDSRAAVRPEQARRRSALAAFSRRSWDSVRKSA